MPKVWLFVCFLFFIAGKDLLAQKIVVKTWYSGENSQLKEKYYISDSVTGRLEGLYISYYASGKKEMVGHYHNNIADSIWTYYYENGHIKMRGPVNENSHNGLWEFYYENGQLNKKGLISNNKKEGKWQYFFENGQLKAEGAFLHNIKKGIWDYFYEDGNLKAQAFYINGCGLYKEFYPDGKLKAEGHKHNGKRDSTWNYYYVNGATKATGNFSDGKKDGLWTYFYPNGLTSAQGLYKNGRKNGKWTYFHQNGTISSEGALKDDKKEGYWKIFNEKGKFTGEGIYTSNNGTFREYYESGQLKAEGMIEKDTKNGLWKYYYESGELEGKCLYNHGTGKYTGYYRDGTLKMEGQIENGVNVGLWKLFNKDGSLAGYYRPYYEEDKPIYKLVEKPGEQRGDYTKPAYKYKNKKLRYFVPVINEYRGFILATDPLALVIGKIPFSLEYYMQERLGYELQVQVIRKPFFVKNSNVDLNETYSHGWDLAIKQKFYSPEKRLGMFYFGHEIRVTSINYFSNILDSVSYTPPAYLTLKKHQTKIEYSILVGNRWMTIYSDQWRRNSIGFTIDAFAGIGIGYRYTKNDFNPEPQYENVFDVINDSKFAVSPRFGINFGIIF